VRAGVGKALVNIVLAVGSSPAFYAYARIGIHVFEANVWHAVSRARIGSALVDLDVAQLARKSSSADALKATNHVNANAVGARLGCAFVNVGLASLTLKSQSALAVEEANTLCASSVIQARRISALVDVLAAGRARVSEGALAREFSNRNAAIGTRLGAGPAIQARRPGALVHV
jgi:hypothetical protein